MQALKESALATQLSRLLVAMFLVVGAGAGIAGCESNDGPVEEAGESIDEGIEEAGDEIDDAS